MARHKRFRHHKSGSSALSITNVLLAGAIYGVARPYVAGVLPDFFPYSDNAIIGAAGGMALWKGQGIVKALGAVTLASEAGAVVGNLTAGALKVPVQNSGEW